MSTVLITITVEVPEATVDTDDAFKLMLKRLSRMGNKARTKKVPASRRSEIAREAAEARWHGTAPSKRRAYARAAAKARWRKRKAKPEKVELAV